MRLRLPPFTVRWVTAVVVATYISIFALVIQVHEVLPSVGVTSNSALDKAWLDLHTVCAILRQSNGNATNQFTDSPKAASLQLS